MISRPSRFAVLLVACMPSLVAAQMHRCETPDGRKVFSDAPCDRVDIDLDKSSEMITELPPPSVRLAIEYYDVRGKTVAEVQRDAVAKGLHGGWDSRIAVGLARSRFAFHPDTVDTPRGCALRRLLVTLDTTIFTPRWVETPGTRAEMRAKIDKWVRYVEGHERGHYAVAVQAAYDLRERLSTVAPARHCIQITNELHLRLNRFLAHHNNLQADFHRREWAAEGR